MSPAHFSRQFRAAYGETPYSYLMTRRIERAMALLRAGVSVTDACMAVGCTSLGSFSSRFAEIVGETPTDVPQPRARRRQGDAGLRGEDAHPPGRATASSRIEEATRQSRGLESRHDNRTPVHQHHRQRRRRVDRLLPRRARPRGAERRRLRRLPLGHARQRRAARPRHRALRAARRPLAGRRRRACRSCSPRASCRCSCSAPTTSTRPSRPCAPPAPRCCRSRSTMGCARDCAFRDPSGNMVRIAQATPRLPRPLSGCTARYHAVIKRARHQVEGVQRPDRPGRS